MSASNKPYWIDGRDEHCSTCGHGFSHGSGARCAACDTDLCALCRTVIHDEAFCSACEEHERKQAKRKK